MIRIFKYILIIYFLLILKVTFAFDYILGVENENKILENKAKMLDLDVLDSDKNLLQKLKKKNKFLIGYINAGAIENYREDYKKFPKKYIGKIYPGWEDEKFLDIKNYKSFSGFFIKYLDIAKQKGFDAIEFDNIDIYNNFEETGFKIIKQDELNFLNFLEKETHKRGLKIFQKNAPELAYNLVGTFDGAIVENGFTENTINNFLVYIKNNKLVYNVEYTDNLNKNKFLKNICPKSTKIGIISILKNRNLDNFISKCPIDKNEVIINKYTKIILNYINKKNINLEIIIDRIEKLMNKKKISFESKIIVNGMLKKLKNKICTDYYPIHKNIIASIFWVGEKANLSNAYISNKMSAWDEE